MTRSRFFRRADADSVSSFGVLSGFAAVCAMAATVLVSSSMHSSAESPRTPIATVTPSPTVTAKPTPTAKPLTESERARQKALSTLVQDAALSDVSTQTGPKPAPESADKKAQERAGQPPASGSAANRSNVAPRPPGSAATTPVNPAGKTKGWAKNGQKKADKKAHKSGKKHGHKAGKRHR